MSADISSILAKLAHPDPPTFWLGFGRRFEDYKRWLATLGVGVILGAQPQPRGDGDMVEAVLMVQDITGTIVEPGEVRWDRFDLAWDAPRRGYYWRSQSGNVGMDMTLGLAYYRPDAGHAPLSI